MNLNKSVILSPDVLSQEVNGETVLLDLKSELYFGLDEVGTRIWQLLSSGRNLSDAMTQMLIEFEVEETTLLKDIERLLDDMAEQGIIELHGPD